MKHRHDGPARTEPTNHHPRHRYLSVREEEAAPVRGNPILPLAVDGRLCEYAGRHLRSTRHHADECPVLHGI